MIDIKFEDLNAWLEKYDSNAEIDVLLDLINKKIKIECLVDSIMCYAKQDYENADLFYKEMWYKNQKPYCKECKSLNVATHDQNGSPITDFANRNGYCFNCNDYAKIKGVAHDND
tara:strand:+ start:268 stop:612 length:345 start_codon:yes stop_codon:yes gene_type:complete